MLSFVIYELKVAVILAAFYLCFKCFLANEKMHRTNRATLILTAVLSLTLPFCIITFHKTLPMPEPVAVESLNGTVSNYAVAVTREKNPFNWGLLVVFVYWTGVAFVFGSTIVGIVRVMRLIQSGKTEMMYGTEVTICEGNVSPFSWMKWIVLCRADFESGNKHILEHERAHIRFGHSNEVLLFDILAAFQWFNPAMWLLKRDLRAIHEYEADDAVLRGGADIKEYQYSLIRKAVSASGYSITNSFNHSILKNRITMMSKPNASRMRWLRAFYILPLICGALALNARTVTDYKVSENSQQQTVEDSHIRIELQKDEKGEYSSFTVNGNVAFDDISDVISSFIEGGKPVNIDIVAPADAKCGDVQDVKEVLRKMSHPVKVRYFCPGIVNAVSSLPPTKIEYNPKYRIYELGANVVERKNLVMLKVNSADRILFAAETVQLPNIDELEKEAAKAISDNPQCIISFQADRGTSYGVYVNVLNKIYSAYDSVREDYAKVHFGKPCVLLNDEEAKTVREAVPIQFSEVEAKEAILLSK